MTAWLNNHPLQHERPLLLITAVFIIINAIPLALLRGDWFVLLPTAVWLTTTLIAHLLLAKYKPHHDPYLWPLVSVLMGWGLLLISRLAPNFVWRQTVWVVVGTAVLLAVAILPKNLRPLRRYRYTWLFGGLLLMAITLIFGVNPSGYGAALWLPIPSFGQVYFQPSELLKLLLVIFFASYFAERDGLLRRENGRSLSQSLPYLAPLLLMWGFCMILLVWQRDLGAATIFFMLFLSQLYLSSGERRYLLAGAVLLLISSVIAYFAFDLVALRIEAWWNPWADAAGRAYQIVQSLYAIAAGGLVGQGIGQGFPGYIPVVHSDFVFAAIAEEWGAMGAVGTIAIFMLLAGRGMKVAMMGKRPFRFYLAAGITVLFSTQALLIMGGVTKLLPLTGVTLPFISYGGSSLLISSIMVGLLLNADGHTTLSPVSRFVPSQLPQLLQLTAFILASFVLVTASLFFWTAVRAPSILAREDNPRLVEAALRVQRGTIFDQNSAILAETVGEKRLSREYPPISSPAVGYYSFRHGTAGVEQSMDAFLSGNNSDNNRHWLRELLHEPQVGGDVRLSIDAAWQARAEAALGAQTGAIVVFKLEENSANIVALSSHPSYDPNVLDAEFEQLTAADDAPLLNRAAQGQYQPGMVLQPFLIAAALDAGVIALDGTVEHANRPVVIGDNDVQATTHCLSAPPSPTTWADVLLYQCPAPMAELGEQMGVDGLTAVFTQFQLLQPPSLPLDTATPPVAAIDDPAQAAIGQDTLLLTPLQVGLAWAALMKNGRLPTLQLVLATRNVNGGWLPYAQDENGAAAITPPTAAALRNALPQHNGLIEHSLRALSGPDGGGNSWYVGYAPDTGYAVVVVIEDSEGVAEAVEAGRMVLGN